MVFPLDVLKRKNAGGDATIVRYLIADDGAFYDIHDEPNTSFYTFDLDVGFIGCENSVGMVIIVIFERFYIDSSSFEIIHDRLVRNFEAWISLEASVIFLRDSPRFTL